MLTLPNRVLPSDFDFVHTLVGATPDVGIAMYPGCPKALPLLSILLAFPDNAVLPGEACLP